MRIARLCLLTLAIFALSLHAAAAIKDTRPVVKIGVMLPLTGNLAYIGEQIVFWKQMAEKELASQPTRFRYEIILEDDQNQGRLTALAMRRLVTLNNVNVLFSYGSVPGAAVAPYAEEVKIPHIACAYDPRSVVGNYSLSFLTPPAESMPAFLKLIAKKNYHKLAIVSVRSATWQPVLDLLHANANPNTYSIVYEKVHAPGDRDFRLSMQGIPADVDAIMLLAWMPEIETMSINYHQAGVKKPLIGLGGSYVVAAHRDLLEGAIDVYYSDLTKPNQINIQKTGKALFNNSGPAFTDELKLIINTYEALGEADNKIPSGSEVMTKLKNMEPFEGITGRIKLLPSKFFSFPVNYYKIEKNGFKVVSIDEL